MTENRRPAGPFVLAAEQAEHLDAGMPKHGAQLGAPLLFPVRKPRLDRATYAKHYNAGWAASRRGSEMAEDRYAGRHGLGLFSPEVDAWVDGFLDEAHGLRGKWHLRDCRRHENDDHPASCGQA